MELEKVCINGHIQTQSSNNSVAEGLTQTTIVEVNKELNSEHSVELLYKYLGDPKDRIDYFNEEDYAILQERLKSLEK